MAKPDVQQQMEKQAFLLSPSTPEKLGEFVKRADGQLPHDSARRGVQPE
jgi:hypothetical protein